MDEVRLELNLTVNDGPRVTDNLPEVIKRVLAEALARTSYGIKVDSVRVVR